MHRLLAMMALSALSVTAAAQSLGARDIEGQKVEVDTRGTLVVFWSLDDADSRTDLKELQELADAGQHVLAVNVDGAQRRSELKPFVRRHGWTLSVVSDMNGRVARSLDAKAGDTVLLAPGQNLTAAWRGERPSSLHQAPETSVARAWLQHE